MSVVGKGIIDTTITTLADSKVPTSLTGSGSDDKRNPISNIQEIFSPTELLNLNNNGLIGTNGLIGENGLQLNTQQFYYGGLPESVLWCIMKKKPMTDTQSDSSTGHALNSILYKLENMLMHGIGPDKRICFFSVNGSQPFDETSATKQTVIINMPKLNTVNGSVSWTEVTYNDTCVNIFVSVMGSFNQFCDNAVTNNMISDNTTQPMVPSTTTMISSFRDVLQSLIVCQYTTMH